VTEPGDGTLGDIVEAIRVEGDSVIASALYPKGSQVLLRLYEHRGATVVAKMSRVRGHRNFAEVDLTGQPVGKFTGTVSLRPWQIRTFALRDAD
jgi:hypothetical protein